MIVATPENGSRARLQRVARGTAVFAMALGLCGLVIPAADAAVDGGDTNPIDMHVAAGGDGIVTPGITTSASIVLQNGGDDRLSAGRVEIELNRTALADQEAVSAWLDTSADDDASDESAPDESGFATIADGPTEPVDAGGTGTVSMLIAQERLEDLAPGVYPIRATLSDATTGSTDDEQIDRDTTAHSVVVVSATGRPPITVLVPVTATPADGALLTAEELTTLTAEDGDLTAQLDGVTGTSAVLAVDPAILTAIRVLGTSAPASAVEWMQRLDALPNERFALQFADADATAQAKAGLTTLLGPTTLDTFLDEADFPAPPQPTDIPAQTATPEPTEPEPLLPEDEMLTAVDGAVPGILWPRGGADADDLAAFRSYLGDDVTTILPSSTVSATSGHATVAGGDVLVTNTAVSSALSKVANTGNADLRGAALATANAALYFAGTSTTGPLIVGLDRDENRTADALRAAVAAADSPGVGLSSIRSSAAAAGSLVEADVYDRGASVHLLLDDEVTLGAFATILDDAQLLLSPERIRVLRVLGVQYGDDAFDEAVTAHRSATRETLAAVEIPQASTIQLLSANADLPFAVRNDLPWPVNVVLAVSPSDPRLEVQSVTPAVVPAGNTSRIKVPVSARVGSGELNLRLSLSSPTGVQLGQDQTVRVAVRAEWEGIGLTIFGALIVILIVLGVARTVHRRRKAKRNTATDADAAIEADADTDDAPEAIVDTAKDNT